MSAMPQPHVYMTEQEYLVFERESDLKHEYVNDEIIAMAGASWKHTVIVSNINTQLNIRLNKSSCISVTNDLRVHIASKKSYRYPDIVVVCGEPQFVDDDDDVLKNPIVLMEVLFPSTAVIDRNDKLDEYFLIPSLQEYLLIFQEKPRIERFLRDEAHQEWRFTKRIGLEENIFLPSLNCKLGLSGVYKQVTFRSGEQ